MQGYTDAVIAGVVNCKVEVTCRKFLLLAEVEQGGLVFWTATVETQANDDFLETFSWRLRCSNFSTCRRSILFLILLLFESLIRVLQNVMHKNRLGHVRV